jgi:hypothetical protein
MGAYSIVKGRTRNMHFDSTKQQNRLKKVNPYSYRVRNLT